VLLDAHMPGMDGFAVARQIGHNSHLAGATIMMLTSGDAPGDAARSRAAGVAAFLTKPVRQADLRRAMVAALGAAETSWGRLVRSDATLAGPIQTQPARSLHVLLAEDSPVNQKLAVRLLEKRGHRVSIAANGVEAVAAYRRGGHDVILMDVQMPDMDGYDATQAIRTIEQSTGKHVPIIAMTAHAMRGDRDRCLAAGMDYYLAKPIRANEVIEAVEAQAARAAAAAPPSPSPVPARTGHQPEVFDLASGLERAGGDTELFGEMLRLFLAECPRLLTDMQRALADQDAAKLRLAAHTIKGSADTIAARSACAAAARLEAIARAGELHLANSAWVSLEQEIARLCPVLEAQVNP
jgi:CheY-like chemotaxis protein/HPt (histidine-containing phosphotransfer) domain-containing protein